MESLQHDPRELVREIRCINEGYDQRRFLLPEETTARCCYITNRLLRDYESSLDWEWVKDEWQHVKDMMKASSVEFRPSMPLTLEVDRALGAFEVLVVNRLYRALGELRRGSLEVQDWWTVEKGSVDENGLQTTSTFVPNVTIRSKSRRSPR